MSGSNNEAVTFLVLPENQWRTLFKLKQNLARAMANAKQQKAAGFFNNAFTAGASAIGDGQAFISTAHPVKQYANNNADLSQTALETSCTDSKLKDDKH